MKKLLLILCLACSSIIAQPVIISYTPHAFCPGDDICLTIYNPTGEPFYFNIEAPNVLYWFEVYPEPGTPEVSVYCFTTPNLGDLEQGTGYVGINLESQYHIVIYCPATVGITEWELNSTESKFFDLQGQPCDPERGKLLIEQRGKYRRKVILE